jgi:phytoene dehydrogenase-like protein
LARPIALGQRTQERLVVKHYAFDPTMADSGKSVLTLWCQADYDYWKELRRDLDAYEAAKAQIGQEVVAALDQRYPGLAAEVEALDVATPVTYERYTSNRRGAIHGWAMSRRKLELMMGGGMRKTLHGLRNFYMAGQWVEPGGNVQLAAASGRDCLELICRHNDRAFVTFI